jgi:hypothetical protein
MAFSITSTTGITVFLRMGSEVSTVAFPAAGSAYRQDRDGDHLVVAASDGNDIALFVWSALLGVARIEAASDSN